jgi:ATP-dependent Lhr-like helicase
MTAYVQLARRDAGIVPRWNGARMPLSSELADALLAELEAARAGRFDSAELQRVRPLLEIQQRWSEIPSRDTLLLETWQSREGRHLYCYPFAGRLAHLGIASLLAWRLGRAQPATFSLSVNDYGFELMTAAEIEWTAALSPARGLLSDAGLLDDILASLNAGELSARRFREIARVAGLVFQGYPGQPKSARQLQASSGLFYEVLRKYDAGNLLLGQADREVLEQELDLERIRAALAWMRSRRPVLRAISRPTPFAFPLLVERLREQLSTEKLADRVARMVAELERRAGATD